MSTFRGTLHRPDWQQIVVCETFAMHGKGINSLYIQTFISLTGRGFLYEKDGNGIQIAGTDIRRRISTAGYSPGRFRIINK